MSHEHWNTAIHKGLECAVHVCINKGFLKVIWTVTIIKADGLYSKSQSKQLWSGVKTIQQH